MNQKTFHQLKVFGGWVVAIIATTIFVYDKLNEPAKVLDERINNISSAVIMLESHTKTIQAEHGYYNDKLDKSFKEFKESLDKVTESSQKLNDRLIRLETIVGDNLR